MEAPLVRLSIAESGKCNDGLSIVCAVVEMKRTEYEMILPADVASDLKNLPNVFVTSRVSSMSAVNVGIVMISVMMILEYSQL